MNVNIYYTKVYKNETAFRRGKNKPNSNQIKPNLQKAKMNVNLTLTKDYRKKDDFVVRINKPNFRNGQNERKLTYNKGLQKKRCFRSPKNKPNTNPIQTQSKPILKRMNVNFCVTGYYIYKIALSVNSYTRPLVRKINHFLVKSLPKIAEKRLKMAFCVHKKGRKTTKNRSKAQFGKEVKNVLELI